MAKPLAVTQKQVVAILKGAEKAGVRLSIKAVNGAVIFIKDEETGEPPAPVRKKPKIDL
jgi:hypothetical protein